MRMTQPKSKKNERRDVMTPPTRLITKPPLHLKSSSHASPHVLGGILQLLHSHKVACPARGFDANDNPSLAGQLFETRPICDKSIPVR